MSWQHSSVNKYYPGFSIEKLDNALILCFHLLAFTFICKIPVVVVFRFFNKVALLCKLYQCGWLAPAVPPTQNIKYVSCLM